MTLQFDVKMDLQKDYIVLSITHMDMNTNCQNMNRLDYQHPESDLNFLCFRRMRYLCVRGKESYKLGKCIKLKQRHILGKYTLK